MKEVEQQPLEQDAGFEGSLARYYRFSVRSCYNHPQEFFALLGTIAHPYVDGLMVYITHKKAQVGDGLQKSLETRRPGPPGPQ
jgi:hypothetical protein